MWIKNTSGKPDAVLTMTIIAFIVVMVKVMLGGTDLVLAGWNVRIEPISADLAAVLLGVHGAVYAFRRHTDRKYDHYDEIVRPPHGDRTDEIDEVGEYERSLARLRRERDE